MLCVYTYRRDLSTFRENRTVSNVSRNDGPSSSKYCGTNRSKKFRFVPDEGIKSALCALYERWITLDSPVEDSGMIYTRQNTVGISLHKFEARVASRRR